MQITLICIEEMYRNLNPLCPNSRASECFWSDDNDGWFVCFFINLYVCLGLMHTYTLNFKCTHTKKCTYGLHKCSEEGQKHIGQLSTISFRLCKYGGFF